MPIISYTGLPGHGKTSLMMEDLLAEAAKGERPIFAAGIDGLQPGLAEVLADPRKWNELRPGRTCICTEDGARNMECDAHVVPHGSKIYVDEAWKWFGHLQVANRQSTPDHVLHLAEHRHRGIDFVWTYQQPCQIYPFARGLCADHYHVVRRFGTGFIDVFKWEELNEDPKSPGKRDAAQRTTRRLPEAAWKAYKSAELHTIKRRIPFKVMALPAFFVVGGLLLWFAYSSLKPAAATPAPVVEERPEGAQATPADHVAKRERGYATVSDYVEAHLARIPTMPWSAKVFDGRNVSADPQLFCAASGAGEDANGDHREASCTCMTEQGTPYRLTDAECRMVARQGAPYNPYKKPKRETSRGDGAGAPSDTRAEREAPLPGIVLEAEQVSAYGDIEAGQDGGDS